MNIKGRSVTEVLEDAIPERRFSHEWDGKKNLTLYYDAYLTEDEEMQVHEILDSIRPEIKYTMIRMTF